MVFGSDDLALEKQQRLNSLTDEIKILEEKFAVAKYEELSIESYQKKMGGIDSETDISINETKKEIQANKLKYKELLLQ